MTSWTGYAGGSKKGNPPDTACYHNALFRNDYGKLGHGEVVQMQIPSKNYKQFAEVYAGLFDKNGDRPDKGDRGPEYRHLVGIPGGVKSPLFKDLEEVLSKRGISVLTGKGDDGDNLGKKSVWVMDLAEFPFYRAEAYHQYHDGFFPGEDYPKSYNQLKDQAKEDGRLQTSKICPDEGTWEKNAE